MVPETADELDESPTPEVARNVTLYSVLSLSPVTTIGEVVEDASTNACPFNAYLYVVMAEPPLLAGALNDILNCLIPGIMELIVGASGTFQVVAETADELDESPMILAARNNTLYTVLFDKLVTTMGDDVVDASTNV